MTALEVGDEVPDFELKDQHGQRFRLSSLRGTKAAVVVFYPSTFSPVCSSELSTLGKGWPELDRPDVELVTVACDPMFTLRAFSDQEGIEFRMLSDFWPHGEVSAAYGVLDEDLGCSKRSTFILDKGGRLRWSVHNAMPDSRSVDDYVGALDFLNGN